MADQALPSKLQFLQTQIAVLTCTICHEGFNETHPPAQCQGKEKCQHIFGLPCLLKWFRSEDGNTNACPVCREPLFRKLPKPKYKSDIKKFNTPIWLDSEETLEEAVEFVAYLWQRLGNHFEKMLNALEDLGDEGDDLIINHSFLERNINEALRMISQTRGTDHMNYFIRPKHWPVVIRVAEAMMNTHFDKGEFDPTANLDPFWERVLNLFGWEFNE